MAQDRGSPPWFWKLLLAIILSAILAGMNTDNKNLSEQLASCRASTAPPSATPSKPY